MWSSFCLKSSFLSDFEGFGVRRLLFLITERQGRNPCFERAPAPERFFPRKSHCSAFKLCSKKRSLSYNGSVLWNSLSLKMRQLTSLNIFKGKLKNFNQIYVTFAQSLLVKQVFCYYIFVISVFILDSSSLVTQLFFQYLNVNVFEGNTVYKNPLPYLCDGCVNLSFAMALDNTTSPDYQLCVKTMYQALDKEIVEVTWCNNCQRECMRTAKIGPDLRLSTLWQRCHLMYTCTVYVCKL